MDEQLVDQIYESSVVPELWENVLEQLRHVAGGEGCILAIKRDDIGFWASSPDAATRSATIMRERWLERGTMLQRGLANHHPGFFRDIDLLPSDELAREPIYRDFWRPQGIGWVVGTFVPMPTGEHIMLGMSRRTETGPPDAEIVRKLDALRPHLCRSFLLAARLRLERARNATQTLAALGIPAMVLDDQGKALAVNEHLVALKQHLQWRANDRVGLLNKDADKLLREAMSQRSEVRTFPVRPSLVQDPGQATDDIMLAHVVPIRLSARDIFTRGTILVVMTPLVHPNLPPVELLRALFDLTSAEARVARSLASGATVQDIAATGGVAPSTVRTQVRSVLSKTGFSRQSDVVALLTGIWSPGSSA